MEISEVMGYLASLGVLLSFTLKNVRNLRIVNSVGCFFFVIYGYMISGWPIIVTNVAIILVNFYYLFIKKD